MEIQNEEGPRMELVDIARENFGLWAKTLRTKDPKKVAELYSKDCTFHPTMSPDFKKGASGAEEYFEHFLQKNPEGKITEEAVQSMGQDAYLHSGMYTFEVDNGGSRSFVPARFSMGWRRNSSGKWEMFHHHSSVLPN